jgi:hypothetical protein
MTMNLYTHVAEQADADAARRLDALPFPETAAINA